MPYIGMPKRKNGWTKRPRYAKSFIFPPTNAFTYDVASFEHYIAPVGYLFNEDQESYRKFSLAEDRKKLSTPYNIEILGTFSEPFSFDEYLGVLGEHGTFARYTMVGPVIEKAIELVTKKVFDQDKIENLAMKEGFHKSVFPLSTDTIALGLSNATWMKTQLRASRSSRAKAILEDWYARIGGIRPCQLCGSMFDRVWLIPGYYTGTLGYHVCLSCEMMEYPTGEKLLGKIRQFVEVLGYIPNAQLALEDYNRLRLPNRDKYLEICRAWMEMGGIHHVRYEHESWFQGLAKAGVFPDGTQVTKRGIRCLARDGHMCLSLAEQMIDNWLYDHGIPHERETPYPVHPDLSRGTYRSDWKVNDVYIEYFGLTGEPSYDAKTKSKIELAKSLNIKLIELYPADMANLDSVLQVLLDKQS